MRLKHSRIMRFLRIMHLATSLAELKLILINKWYYRWNSTTNLKLECGQLAPRSDLSRNNKASRKHAYIILTPLNPTLI